VAELIRVAEKIRQLYMLRSCRSAFFASRVIGGLLGSQGGGHGNLRFVTGAEGLIAKPFNPREARFYELIQSLPLYDITPKYYGSATFKNERWTLLEDLTQGMSSPCIGDFKLGTRSYEVTAPLKKQQSQLSHTLRTTTRSHGIRLVDVCLRSGGKIVDRWNRREGRRLSAKELKLILNHFIGADRTASVAAGVQTAIRKLQQTYAIAPNIRLYSASVMMLFDGDIRDAPAKVSIIDFAHAYYNVNHEGGDSTDPSFDDNALLGLHSLSRFISPR
jgi:hypothetical protein